MISQPNGNGFKNRYWELAENQSPNLSSKETHYNTHNYGQYCRNYSPFPAFSFFIYRVDCCGTGIMQQTKKH